MTAMQFGREEGGDVQEKEAYPGGQGWRAMLGDGGRGRRKAKGRGEASRKGGEARALAQKETRTEKRIAVDRAGVRKKAAPGRSAGTVGRPCINVRAPEGWFFFLNIQDELALTLRVNIFTCLPFVNAQVTVLCRLPAAPAARWAPRLATYEPRVAAPAANRRRPQRRLGRVPLSATTRRVSRISFLLHGLVSASPDRRQPA